MEGAHRLDRWLYRGGRPNRLARLLNGVSARLGAAGIGPERLAMLQVTGRRTGRLVSFPVVVADYHGERYLVSMLGENTNWVRNVRAADGRAVLRRRHREAVQLEEVPPAARAGILRRYLQCAPGARPHVPVDPRAPEEAFGAIAGDYPVFRVRSVDVPNPDSRPSGERTSPSYAVGVFHDLDFGPDILEYLQRIDETLAPFGGRFLIHGGPHEAVEGQLGGDLVVIAFPTPDGASRWYHSDAYQAIAPLRRAHSAGSVTLHPGVPAAHRATDILSPHDGDSDSSTS